MSDRPIAVVTGAGRGIGRRIALALAGAGHDVVLAARSEEDLAAVAEECRQLGAGALAVATDLRVAAEVERLRQEVGAFGPVEVLVNNSGVGGPSGPLWEIEPEDWAETLAVNVTGVFLCCREFLPEMVERRSGAVINIGSITGKRPLLNRSPYATSKMALVGLTRTLALEAGPYGVRVNLISPGFVEGPRIDWVIERQAAARGVDPETVRAEFTAESPLGRFTGPDDVAAVAVFLASQQAAAITGADINVNAGVVMY